MFSTIRWLAICMFMCAGATACPAQGAIPNQRSFAPHDCHRSFEQCLAMCTARGGTAGTGHSCADRCGPERNCTNSPETGGNAEKPGLQQAPAGGSCSRAFARCQSNCVKITGKPDCAATGCENLRAKCLASGCWQGPQKNLCGLAKN
jgi:hypothetical protein